MKNRFTLVDVICAVEDIKNSCVGLRANNFYDIDKKTYLVKLGSGQNKAIILIEYGMRIHTTDYVWTKNMLPSSFSMKCRKTIGNRRLSSVKLLGVDRIVDFTFGTTETCFHLIVELYDKGNLLLTDWNYVIISVLRPRKLNEEEAVSTSQKYNIDSIRNLSSLMEKPQFMEMMQSCEEKTNIKKFLTQKFPLYGSVLLDHCLIQFNFPKNTRYGVEFLMEIHFDSLYEVLKLAHQTLIDFLSGNIKGGYITYKTVETLNRNNSEGKDNENKINEEFLPYLFNQFKGCSFLQFNTFCEAVDQFFSQIEEQKTQAQLLAKERTAGQKVINFTKDHETRIQDLSQAQNMDALHAQLIQCNIDLVNEVIGMVNICLSRKHSWDDIKEFIADSKEEGNPLGLAIDYLKFETNQVAVFLQPCPDFCFHPDTPVDYDKIYSVLLDLSYDAYGNVKSFYETRRFAVNKVERMNATHGVALKSAKKKMEIVLKENIVKVRVKKNRKVNWFETYRWFISSENYLVLGGRDAQENEVLVKRHGKKNDIFVHADIVGTSAVIIKVPNDRVAPENELPVPAKTLHEAATFAVCFGSAWENRVTVNVYWVNMSQVTKTAPTGEYLKVGGFSIKGNKNYLTPPMLVLGIGILFKLDATSTLNHLNDRTNKSSKDDQISEVGSKPSEQEPEKDQTLSSEEDISESVEDMNKDQSETDSCESETDFPDNLPNTEKITECMDEIQSSEPGHPCDGNENVKEEFVDRAENIKKDLDKPSLSFVPKIQTPSIPKENINNGIKPNNNITLKRGQRYKKKKINTKYKDQDEEDRELAEKLLHVSLKPDTTKKMKKKVEALKNKQKTEERFNKEYAKKVINPKTSVIPGKEILENILDDNDSETDQTLKEENFLSSFCGKPSSEDQLLYAMLAVAPYSALIDYKFYLFIASFSRFKLKMTPGTTKRGKGFIFEFQTYHISSQKRTKTIL